MKKLALTLDDLRVETFTTGEGGSVRGTVRGFYGTNHTETCEPSVKGWTCEPTAPQQETCCWYAC